MVTFIYQYIICDSLKETQCQKLYFEISLYIRKNADLSEKLRYCGLFMTSYRFIIVTVTFLSQFRISDSLKETAFKDLYFEISLQIRQNADMSTK